jgi:hypothetical protein
VVALQIQPELGSRPKRLGEKPGCLRRDTPLPSHDLVYSLYRNTDVLRKGYLSEAERIQELLE